MSKARKIQRAVVIGSGIMGRGIAAHLANSGILVNLLDILPRELTPKEKSKGLTMESLAVRNRLAIDAITEQLKSKLSGFYDPSNAALVTPGNTEDDMATVADADWVIEVVTEDPKIKGIVYDSIEKHLTVGTVISTNTSGIPLASLAKNRSDMFKKHFIVTHFFNPPRFMHLLEFVKSEDTDNDLYEEMKTFAETKLGKGVVECKDTPNFIANRVGCYDLVSALKAMSDNGLTIAEVDAVAGVLMGRPKSAVFRLLDMIGIDVICHVIDHLYEVIPNDESRENYKLPDYVKSMVGKGMCGTKTGKGFYFKDKVSGKSVIKPINLETLEYENPIKPDLAALKKIKSIADTGERLKALVNLDNKLGKFAWQLISEMISYASHRVPEISNTIYDVDNAMKWGFNHILGPFETWDALGIKAVAKRLEKEGRAVAPLIKDMMTSGVDCFYCDDSKNELVYSPQEKQHVPLLGGDKKLNLNILRKSNGIIDGDETTSLIDIGNDVLMIELHGKVNAISSKVSAMILKGVVEAEKNFRAAVIGTQGDHFSVGADLKEMMDGAGKGEMNLVYKAIEAFQEMTSTIRYSQIPIVAALKGYVFGGGCEIAMHCASRQISPETYAGLVEAGVGLIPAGGGCKELIARSAENALEGQDLFLYINKIFEILGLAKVASSGQNAINLGLFTKNDGISTNRESLLMNAKERALMLANQGYKAPVRRKQVRILGETGYSEFVVRLNIMLQSGYISEHDRYIGERMAYVLCGGDLPKDSLVPESYLLDLERKIFFELLKTPKTQERITHTLTTGKPLRN